MARRPRRAGARVVGAVAAAVAAAALLACCATPTSAPARQAATGHQSPKAVGSTTTTTTTSVTQPPVTPIAWTACMGDIQCGTLVVPLDYAEPHGPTLPIAVARHPAEEPTARIGSIVIEPGGPGVSGIDDMANELASLTPQLLDDFDIVLFDPRGVERSDPVECAPSAGQAPAPNDPAPTTPIQQQATIASLRQFAADCERSVPTLLAHVGTVDVARDMDLLRQALGDSGLTYMGQSYGTLLGLTYAQLFPTHIRAMVLDGVIDPALTFTEMTQQQAEGFEAALRSFFAWCAGTPPCPWRPAGDPTTTLLDQIAASAANPVPASGRGGQSAGAGVLYDALLGGLYARSDWPELADTLASDAAGNGSPAVSMATHYDQGGSSNGDVAAVAIDCLDHPVTRNIATYASLADSLRAATPVFGPLLVWGEASCAVWPTPPTRTVGPVRAVGAPPILLVGTTEDPATPYSWAVNVSHELARSTLLTVNGQNHVAYFYSACVRAYVQTYLISGVTPPDGATCYS